MSMRLPRRRTAGRFRLPRVWYALLAAWLALAPAGAGASDGAPAGAGASAPGEAETSDPGRLRGSLQWTGVVRYGGAAGGPARFSVPEIGQRLDLMYGRWLGHRQVGLRASAQGIWGGWQRLFQ